MCKEEKIVFDPHNSKKVHKRMELQKRKIRIEKSIKIYESQIKEDTSISSRVNDATKILLTTLRNKLEKIEKEIEEMS